MDLKCHHHHHLSLNRQGRWGTTDDFTTIRKNVIQCTNTIYFNRDGSPLLKAMASANLWSQTGPASPQTADCHHVSGSVPQCGPDIKGFDFTPVWQARSADMPLPT